jgi:hypothetical protein
MEHEYGDNPSVDGRVWRNIGVSEHALNIACVDLDDEIPDANEVNSQSL